MKGLVMNILSHTPHLTSDILSHLLECQSKLNDKILPSINDSQGYGCGAFGQRIELWNLIKRGLDYLCEHWIHALEGLTNPINQLSRNKGLELIADFKSAIDCECRYISSFKHGVDPATYRGTL